MLGALGITRRIPGLQTLDLCRHTSLWSGNAGPYNAQLRPSVIANSCRSGQYCDHRILAARVPPSFPPSSVLNPGSVKPSPNVFRKVEGVAQQTGRMKRPITSSTMIVNFAER